VAFLALFQRPVVLRMYFTEQIPILIWEQNGRAWFLLLLNNDFAGRFTVLKMLISGINSKINLGNLKATDGRRQAEGKNWQGLFSQKSEVRSPKTIYLLFNN
jgi:hypothetical protein